MLYFYFGCVYKYSTITVQFRQICIPSDLFTALLNMNTRFVNALFVFALGLLCSPSSAYSFASIAAKRETLADNEFSFSFLRDAVPVNMSNGIRFDVIGAPRHRLMGMKDVDISFVRVVQPPGSVIPWHVHPRGSENYATISGKLNVRMTLEGTVSVRRIESILPPSHVTSIPQGLPHSPKCISKDDCVYHIFFNSADAGFALTTM